MTQRGHFIVIEGLEGAGKSTALDVAMNVLRAYGIPFVQTREPGGTPVGEVIRTLVKTPPEGHKPDPRTELLLMYASRIELVETVIRPALSSGIWVIGDRFELSSRAYQGGGRRLDQAFIDSLSRFALEGFTPDLLLYLDIHPTTGLERASRRGAFDRFEQETADFFARVHAAYLEGVRDMPHALTVDASESLERVSQRIQNLLVDYVEHHGYHADAS